MSFPRVAFFPDSFHEVNGVAHTARNLAAYAERHDLPFLTVRAGTGPPSPSSLELSRSRFAVPLEKDLFFDPLFPRHFRSIDRALRAFRPDLLHLTGPSELGIAAAIFAWRHRIPLAASWHTNLHEYAGKRLRFFTRHLRPAHAGRVEGLTERLTLDATTRFYRLARVLFAPNPELCNLLEHKTHKPCFLMQRGVDIALFSPERRTRSASDRTLTLGFVGRLSIEKNVALLPRIDAALRAIGCTDFRFVIIGHGALEAKLRARLPGAEFPGVLRGEALARAYANLDLFVFPSHTDTFGNVVLEALASGVPALVTPSGGPRHILEAAAAAGSEAGIVCTDEAFAPAIAGLLAEDRAATPGTSRLSAMRAAARAYALTCSWDAVFDRMYAAYATVLPRESSSSAPPQPSETPIENGLAPASSSQR